MHSPATIIATVAAVTGVAAPAITGKRRTNRIARARFLAVVAIRRSDPSLTLQQTGEIFRRDHGTILHAALRHRDLLKTEPRYARHHAQIDEDLSAQ